MKPHLSQHDGALWLLDLADDENLNAALHRIALIQACLDGLGKTPYQRRLAMNDTKMDALRALKRRLTRVVFQHLTSAPIPAAAPLPQAARHRSNPCLRPSSARTSPRSWSSWSPWPAWGC